MSRPDQSADRLAGLIERYARGDAAVLNELLEASLDRLRRLAGKMLADNPAVRRWEGTDDLLQNAAIRLYRALRDVRPATVRDFFKLAARQIRRELVDLARHHYGPEGHAAHHATDPGQVDPAGDVHPLHERAEGHSGPLTQMQQREFHEHVRALPQEEREVFDLIYYQGLSREEVALTLRVAVRTVKRRWRSARLLLHGLMNSGQGSARPPSEDAAPGR